MNKKIEKHLVLKKSIRNIINKVLVTTIILLIGMILVKNNETLKEKIKENLYEKSFPFQKMKNIYETYFGNLLSVEKTLKKEETVMSEKIAYQKIEPYKKGIKLIVSENYMVPILESGVVVYIGENTTVIEQTDGTDTTYSNVILNNIKLYDYLEKGELIGEVKDQTLFLSFQRKGEYLDYKEYL